VVVVKPGRIEDASRALLFKAGSGFVDDNPREFRGWQRTAAEQQQKHRREYRVEVPPERPILRSDGSIEG
jgi:hypothetical protein